MWPASMFAKSRTLSEISRMNWPRISSGMISGSIAFGHLRDPALEVAHRPVPANPLDVSEDKGHQRERERHRQRRRRSVDPPDVGTPCHFSPVSGSGMKPMMFTVQMKSISVAT